MELARNGSAFPERLGSVSAQAQLGLLFEFLAVALACLIPWGSGADRLRLTAGCALAAVLAAIVFPLLAHWCGQAAGCRNWGSTSLLARDSLTQREQGQSTCWEA